MNLFYWMVSKLSWMAAPFLIFLEMALDSVREIVLTLDCLTESFTDMIVLASYLTLFAWERLSTGIDLG